MYMFILIIPRRFRDVRDLMPLDRTMHGRCIYRYTTLTRRMRSKQKLVIQNNEADVQLR